MPRANSQKLKTRVGCWAQSKSLLTHFVWFLFPTGSEEEKKSMAVFFLFVCLFVFASHNMAKGFVSPLCCNVIVCPKVFLFRYVNDISSPNINLQSGLFAFTGGLLLCTSKIPLFAGSLTLI